MSSSACGCPNERISNLHAVILIVSWHSCYGHIIMIYQGYQTFSANRSNHSVSWHSQISLPMDVQSLYTVIPHHDGLRALEFFQDKRRNQEPSTAVLIRLT